MANDVPTSINPSWILTGSPQHRVKQLARSADRGSYSVAWDCTAGLFNWHYTQEETLVVLTGEAFIRVNDASETRIGPGDVVFFPAGSSAVWRVPEYIRKVAFMREPIPPPLRFGVRAVNAFFRRVRTYLNPSRGQRPF
jgi:uncharacterized cupin superfamily protein